MDGPPPPFFVVRSRWLSVRSGEVHSDGVVVVRGERIVALATGGAARRLHAAAGRPALELDGVLAPGWVNAHAHLDLSALLGEVDAAAGFVPWIGALLRRRAAVPRDSLLAAARQGGQSLLRSGVTLLGDIDTLGLAEEALRSSPLAAVLFREVLDGGRPERAGEALAALDDALSVTPTGAGPRHRGLSPHAPHTVSRTLLAALGARRDTHALPVQVHWAETPEETAWLADGGGPFQPLLGPSPKEDGLELLRRSGLLGSVGANGCSSVSLVHGNELPAGPRGEATLAALAAAHATVVHCPGTHAFFDRPPFPWARYRAAGVTLALGTDSLASNSELDLGAELARARAALPAVDPRELVEAATRGGARALGLPGRRGELEVDAAADFVEFDLSFATSDHAPALTLAELQTTRAAPVRRVWCSGTLAVGPTTD